MTLQEIFDTVATHLFRQGERAYNPSICSCMYRTPEGLKCAVGCLIPDELYQPEMEENLDGIFYNSRFLDVLPDFFLSESVILESLQTIHDCRANWDSSERMKACLIELAELYNLNSDVVRNLRFAWEE